MPSRLVQRQGPWIARQMPSVAFPNMFPTVSFWDATFPSFHRAPLDIKKSESVSTKTRLNLIFTRVLSVCSVQILHLC